MDSAATATTTRKAESTSASRETLTITDNRTGRSYEVPITHGTIRASDLRQIKVDPKEFGMMSYDPAFNNTASCISRVTFIHESIKKFLDGFHYDAHPMGMMISTIAALSTFYHDAKDIFSAESRRKQT